MYRYILVLILFIASFNTNAQTNYGNEWIKDNQKYLKIKVSEDGIYRISHAQLSSVGFLNDTPNPKNFQVFHLGTEIPLHIEGETNNIFEAGEYLEFYGKKNDGKLDETLYESPNLQPNSEISLYSDESYYFLTIGASNGKRYVNTSLSNNSLTPEPYIIYTSSANFVEAYYPGRYLIDVMSLSEYQEGEGYLGNLYGIGTTQSRSIATPNAINTASFIPTLSYYVAGRSNANSTNTSGYNHHLRISINNNTLTDANFKGYEISRATLNLSSSLISSNTTTVNFSSVDDLGAVTDFQAAAYARITYARNLDANGITYLPFKLSTSNNSEAILTFTNNNWNDAYILDEISGFRYVGIKSGTSTSFVVKNNPDRILHLYASNAFKTPSIENVTFNLIKSSSFNAKLLIVTHKNLLQSATEYASYKNSKGYNTLLVTTDELYNQFFYGQHNPLAIKNLARYLLLSNTTVKPEYLLLLGKGYETPKFKLNEDLVPTLGYPSSDSYLTSEIIDTQMAPALATGRVPAKTNEEVLIYLNKLKQYDQQENATWRKNIINITGGANSSEDSSFSLYLKSLSSVAGKEYFGAKTINYYKSVTDPITDNLMSKISNNINSGVGLLNFLGHGSTVSTAVSIGNPSYLNNSNKLLVYIINGCSTGNAFVNGSLGEDYIFQDNKGAIAWIGTSSEGVASYLYNYTNLLFQNSFNTNYGSSIAKNMARSARSYQSSSDNLNKAHLRQYIFLGDPTVSFYSPTLPDYEIKNQDIGLEDKNITVNSPNIKLFAIIKNLGKATSNSIPIQVSRTLPNNTVINYPINNYNKVLNTDTIIVELDNNLPNIAGNNKFTFTVDPNNTISELNKLNNTGTFSYVIQSTGIAIISPSNFSITNETSPELKVQANNTFAKNINYTFELDTVETFNSSWKKTSASINGDAIASWKPSFVPENAKVYYWRAKQIATTGIENEWQTSSFTFINNVTYGWNQSHHQQYENITGSNIIFNNTEKNFEFTPTAFPILIRTKGNDGPNATERRIRISISVGALSFSPTDFEGFAIAAFDPNVTFKMYSYSSVYNFPSGGSAGAHGTGQFFFNTNNPVDVDSLTNYLQNIPEGYYVAGFNGKNFNPKGLPQITQDLLNNLGLVKITTINNGEPYAFWTQKKVNKKITPLELTADYSSSTPATAQIIDFSYDFLYPWNNGTITSERIGPSSNWSEAIFDFAKETSDAIEYSVIGVDANGNEFIIKSNITNAIVNLADVPASTFPYLKLGVKVTDNLDRTMPKFGGWRVIFDTYPDLSFISSTASNFYSSKVQQGDSIKLVIGVTNLEKITSDSITVKYKFTKADRSTINGTIKTIKPLSISETENISFSYATNQLPGSNTLQLSIEPKDSKDKNEFNNYVNYDFEVDTDKKEPIIDVYFDNKRIINGELVSPNPKIAISIADENKFLLLTDTNNVELYIKKEDQQNFRRIAFSDHKVSVQNVGTSNSNKIDFLYNPDTFTDGRYTLKLRGKDASGNYNISNDYLVDFEIINEQSISNFLPYPNPFTTSMKFVFQVTGKIPDKIKVQIMTVTGKIVREVFKDELGSINIGNNISDFTWDGTDQFGDRLANGVYFYNVITENNDKSEIKHRANSTDAYFKKNFGKIYLMR